MQCDWNSADSYSSLAIVSALIFGSTVTVWFEVSPEDRESFLDQEAFRWAFCLQIIVSIACSGIGTTVMVNQYYHIRRLQTYILSDDRDQIIMEYFILPQKKTREMARLAVFVSCYSFFGALATYIYAHVQGDALRYTIVTILATTVLVILSSKWRADAAAQAAFHEAVSQSDHRWSVSEAAPRLAKLMAKALDGLDGAMSDGSESLV